MDSQRVNHSVFVHDNEWPFKAGVMTPAGLVHIEVDENGRVKVFRARSVESIAPRASQ